MHRRLWSLLLCGTSLAGLVGCANVLESRVVNSFNQHLEKFDLEGLQQDSSRDFKNTALRGKDPAKALKVLNIPTGEVEVLSVKDEGPDEKRVLVSIGVKKNKRKLYYDLVRDPNTKRWVVDDVEFKRQLKPGQVNKTISEQMELLLSIQDFMDAWEGGKRADILASSTPDLRKTLELLPEAGLKRFTTKVTSDLDRKRVKPEVEGHANMAVVRLPTKSGDILVTLRQIDNRWLADDLAVQSRREGSAISSVRKQAQVMHTAIVFCDAYRQGKKAELAELCVPRFYRLNLEHSDLTRVPLPEIDSVNGDIDVKLLISRAEVLLKHDDQIIQLTLTQGRPELDENAQKVDAEVQANKPFLVEEVTLHELKSKQNKRMSALFTSQSLVQRFAMGVAQRDLKAIRSSATADFNSRVWKRIELDNIGGLPLDAMESQPPQIIDTQFQGSLTEVTVNQGKTPLTYVLRDQGGAIMVDDVLTPALDRPNSLKQTLEVIIPLQTFSNGLVTKQMDFVRSNASREFNKLVFQSMNHIPRMKLDPTPFLDAHVNRIQLTADRALLFLGDERFGAKVFMNKEDEHYVVDDIVLINGIEQSQRTGLKQALRQLVVGGTQIGTTTPRGGTESVDSGDDLDLSELEQSLKTSQREAMPN